MPVRSFPELDPDQISATRDALHAYSRIAGDWLKANTGGTPVSGRHSTA